ncbi:hypothetical protein THASP1DRAFT_24723 [Thamnocephalis sphaerospora]|uniref:Poly(A) RNA polymerase mitochondrial-like central palm domain-containing protein n=1 Tax=Thamnocephalis sphaerospora TaxID=78915 RepID=A0A4P9XMH0_9FUNG|nr:hypothetical protein THASP1DRAFT_24723 [Thamnocephalis sphaerospora]|eukprot:RKP07056.1 hypothetical protein THASP1DRAFT_24723 [Thamnocephalis sphaerospora]
MPELIMPLPELSSALRSDKKTKKLIPNSGFTKWLRRNTYADYFSLVQMPLAGNQNASEDAAVVNYVRGTGRIPPPPVEADGTDVQEDKAPADETPFSKDPDAQLYLPQAGITASEARTAEITDSLERSITADIARLFQELAPSDRERAAVASRVEAMQATIRRQRAYMRDTQLVLFGYAAHLRRLDRALMIRDRTNIAASSSANGLATKDSDVDMCIISGKIEWVFQIADETERREQLKRLVYSTTNILRSMGMKKVQPIARARVPVIKFEDSRRWV